MSPTIQPIDSNSDGSVYPSHQQEVGRPKEPRENFVSEAIRAIIQEGSKERPNLVKIWITTQSQVAFSDKERRHILREVLFHQPFLEKILTEEKAQSLAAWLAVNFDEEIMHELIDKKGPIRKILIEYAKLLIEELSRSESPSVAECVEKIHDLGLKEQEELIEVFSPFRTALDVSENQKIEVAQKLGIKPEEFFSWLKEKFPELKVGKLSQAVTQPLENLLSTHEGHFWHQSMLMASLLEHCRSCGVSPEEMAFEMGALFTIRHPSLREELTEWLLRGIYDGNTRESLKNLKEGVSQDKDPSRYLALPFLLLATIKGESEEEKVGKLLQTITPLLKAKSASGNRIFKAVEAKEALLQALHALASDENGSPRQKLNLLKTALEANKEEVVLALRIIFAVYGLKHHFTLLYPAKSIEEMKGLFTVALEEEVPLQNVDHLPDKLNRIMGQFRDPTALFVYTATLNKLNPSRWKEMVLDRLSYFFEKLLDGTFAVSRYEDNPHLEAVFKNHPQLKAVWTKGAEAPLNGEEARKGWKIVDSDDPADLLLCGTEVKGSCGKVNGDPQKAHALLGYILDGKSRLLAIKNEGGVIQGRAILRILIDDQGKPSLFLEGIYPDQLESALHDRLVEFAMERANAMQLPLYSKEVTTDSFSPSVTLASMGCPAPFEYVDALGGIQMGEWKIHEAYSLYTPK